MADNPNHYPDRRRETRPLEPTTSEGQQGSAPRAAGRDERTELYADQGAPQEPVMAWLVITSQGPHKGQLVRLKGPSFLVGRASDCDLVLDDPGSSRQHARIRVEQAGHELRFVIHDLATDSGILVNGQRLPSAELHNGDLIRIGRTELTFKRLT